MKRIIGLMLVVLTLAAMLLTSCSSGSVTVRVLDGDKKVICEQVVKLGEKNPDSITGETFYALDCLEAALKQAKIEYFVNKEDADSFVVTIIGDIEAGKKEDGKTYQFVYYRKDEDSGKFVDKTGLTAQHDEMEGGEVLEFRYEEVVIPTVKK